MGNYEILKRKMIDAAKSSNVKLLMIIGSYARKTDSADNYSDIDFIIVTDEPDGWLYGEIPKKLGDMKISFIEPTLGGGVERRGVYDDYLDVDMVVLTEAQFRGALAEGVISHVAGRGYQVLYDTADLASVLPDIQEGKSYHPSMSEADFTNMVNDFYFHVIWATKKLCRGELWSAKMNIDAYLKNYLLKMIELYCYTKYKCDVWHDGRFLDKWADDDIKSKLIDCFAHYDFEDMKKALDATEKLFARLAGEIAKMLGYEYPDEAQKYAEEFKTR